VIVDSVDRAVHHDRATRMIRRSLSVAPAAGNQKAGNPIG
jgi:hypothetical protein